MVARLQAYAYDREISQLHIAKIVSGIPGHADVQITLNVYDHPETASGLRAQLADQSLRSVTKSNAPSEEEIAKSLGTSGLVGPVGFEPTTNGL